MHTVETTYELSREQFEKTKDRLYEFSTENKLRCISDEKNLTYTKFYERVDEMTHKNTWGLKLKNGMQIVLGENMFKVNGKISKTFELNYIINLAKVIGGNYTNLYNSYTHDYEKVIQEINKTLELVSPEFPNINSVKIRRVDFSCNIKLRKNQLASYLKIAKSGKFASRIEATAKDENEKRYKPKNSVKIRNRKDGSIKVYLYDKRSQMEKNSLGDFKNDTNAEEILRVEVQISNPKIENLLSKYKIGNLEELLKTSNRMALVVFEKYLYKNFCAGRYYKYNDAMEVIQRSHFNKSIKVRMIRFLECVKKGKSIEIGIEKFKSDGNTSQDVRRIREKLKDLNINPYTLGKRENVEKLDNLYSCILYAMTENF
ncbi:hypothetical protein [Aminipila terrae]|uniref:Uncharacterized protein n=1 Tax=Aminipila terrae TaxID=2697030 RepID=A0A6P1MGQ1_9FIRM|nr:hypothetical protein [Aminipila terrae]QHI73067.1 hypothetical protein Ami3637_12250 [Aminipila terrae]